MKISLTTRAWAQCHTAFAEVGLAAARPELHKLCRHAANENDAATTESLAKFFPEGAMATSGLRNLVKWLETLGLAKDGRLTKAGSALADDAQGKVFIPEKNLFRLAVLSHAAEQSGPMTASTGRSSRMRVSAARAADGSQSTSLQL